MKTRSGMTLVASIAAAALWAMPALAQHDHDSDHSEHAHGEGAAHEAPDSFAAGIAEIDERLENIQSLITAKKLDDVHAEAQVIADVANTLGALALKPDSGVPKEAVKEINKTAKELAGKFDAIDKAGDSGDEAGTKKVLAEMTALQATLKKYAPAGDAPSGHAHEIYFCPMHCEDSKTYDKPGKCPVCEMNLKKLTTDQFTVDVKPIGGTIEAGKPANFLFTLKDPTGLPVKTVEIVHEKPLHLLMVSKDLSWYAHEHPELQQDGTFTFAFTFPAGGEYTLFNDFTPKDVGMQVVPVVLQVEGPAAPPVPLVVDAGKPKTVDGYMVTLDTGGPVKTGGATHFAYTITKDGKPVTNLQPYLGAMGHLVIISQDLKEFVHSHPHEEGAEHGGATKGGPKVDFEAHFKAPGLYKGWAQFQNNGKVITVPFTFSVAAGAGGIDHDHDHGHGH